jgi:hypothetical protein
VHPRVHDELDLATVIGITSLAATVLAAPPQAGVDTDFAVELHRYGSYATLEYGVWLVERVASVLRPPWVAARWSR